MAEEKTLSEIYRSLMQEDFSKYPLQGYRLGLDFGTSYTKASYALNNDYDSISFKPGKKTKPSVVYFDVSNQSLSFFKTKESLMPIHYFKATMADKKEYKVLKEIRALEAINDKDIRDNFEFLCSVFFVANIIKYANLSLSEKYKVQAFASISMGMPMSWSGEENITYNKALFSAIALIEATENKDITAMYLRDIYDIYQRYLPEFDNSLFNPRDNDVFPHMTIPEVVAETNHVLNKKDVSAGYYLIVDIGGGTTDFSFISKEKVPLITHLLDYCKYSIVCELGDEVRKKSSELRYKARFTSAFNKCCVEAKEKVGMKGRKMEVTVFLFGGGAQNHGDYYKSIISDRKNIKSLDVAQISIRNIVIHKEDKDRFIIANQLAKSDDGLKLLSGIPLHAK